MPIINYPQPDFAGTALGNFLNFYMQSRIAENQAIMQRFISAVDPSYYDAQIEVAMDNVKTLQEEANKIRRLAVEKEYDATNKLLMKKFEVEASRRRKEAELYQGMTKADNANVVRMFNAQVRGQATGRGSRRGKTYDEVATSTGDLASDLTSTDATVEKLWTDVINASSTPISETNIAAAINKMIPVVARDFDIKHRNDPFVKRHIALQIAKAAETKGGRKGRGDFNKFQRIKQGALQSMWEDTNKDGTWADIAIADYENKLEIEHTAEDDLVTAPTTTKKGAKTPEEIMELVYKAYKENKRGAGRVKEPTTPEIAKFPTEPLERAEGELKTAKEELQKLLAKKEISYREYQRRIADPYAALEGGILSRQKRPHPLQHGLSRSIERIKPAVPPEPAVVKPTTSTTYPGLEVNKEYPLPGTTAKIGIDADEKPFVIYDQDREYPTNPDMSKELKKILRNLDEKLRSLHAHR